MHFMRTLTPMAMFVIAGAYEFGYTQEVPQQAAARRILADAEKVEISLRLDRAAYFPGERLMLTVTIRNGTAGPLEIPNPFLLRGGAIDLYAPRPAYKDLYPDGMGPTHSRPRRDLLAIRNARVPPTIQLAAAQEMSRSFDAKEKFPADDYGVLPDGSAPRYPGPYRAVYTLAKSVTADFLVVPAVLDASALVPLTGTFQVPQYPDYRDPRKIPPPATHPRATLVAALGGDGAHWVVASRSDKVLTSLLYYLKKRELDSANAAILSSYVRVAQSPLPITSISGVADPDDNITITWIDSSGKSGTVRVDKDRKVLPAK